MTRDIHIYPGPAQLARTTADRVVEAAEAAITARGRFTLVLAGGSTPRLLYETLAQSPSAEAIDWPRVHVFWGDERCVPPDHPDSNYRLAYDTLLSRVPIPAGHLHRLRGEARPAYAAAEYETVLRDFFRASLPRFDLVLLGMGEDGHTASLFPGADTLAERERWVVANHVAHLGAWRLTLTLPALNTAAQVLMLVTGAGKAPRVRAVLTDDACLLPAARVRPTDGTLHWLLDEGAAQLLR